MTGAEAESVIRATTAHDSDTQVTEPQLLAQMGIEYQRLRRWLCVVAPELCKAQVSVSVAAGATTILKSALANFEKLILIERLLQGNFYFPIRVNNGYDANRPGYGLTVEEFPTYLQLRPDNDCVGTYRVTYVAGVSGTVTTSTVFDVPPGLEQVICSRCSAWVRQRLSEDPSYDLRTADDILKEQRPLLMQRYGNLPQPGLIRTR
jgi:hypothetical protein